jgi:salicylate hydroxylase
VGAERRALVAGGGIGGLTAALALARAGLRVDLFERAAGFREIGAGIQLSPNATRVLAHLGVLEALRPLAFVPERTEMRHWQRGDVVSVTPLGASLVERFGFPYLHVHRADLIDVLVHAAAGEPRIHLHPGVGIEAFDNDGTEVRVHTATGDWRGDVLVGADGIHSRVRAGLFGAQAPAFTGNVAWRALVPAERLPRNFVAPAATVWMGPGRHFVHYYVRGGALVNCVCVVEKAGWEVESWTQQGDHDELRADFAGWHDGVTRLIDAMDRNACFKWALFDRPPMAEWGRGRASLLGDACHPTLPFMAQGAAMAIEDAAVLAGCLDGAADVAAALRRYEGLRRERTAGIQLGSRRNAGTFHLVGEAADARDRALASRPGQPAAELFGYDALAVARDPG